MELPITERQFTALASVAGARKGSSSHEAMKLMFVQGINGAEAARVTGLRQGTVSNAKNKMLGAHAQIPQRIALLTEALGK